MGNQAHDEQGGDSVSNLLINEPPLQVLPSLAEKIGLNEAIVLQQLHYWLRHARKNYAGKKWIYKTYDQWREQDFKFWSDKTVRNIFKSLKKKNLVLVKKLADNKQNQVNYYTINYQELNRLSSEIDKKQAADHELSQLVNLTEWSWQHLPDGVGKSYLIHTVAFTRCNWSILPDVKENKKESTKENTKGEAAPAKTDFDFLGFYEQAQDHLKLAGMIPTFGPVNDTQLKPEIYKFVQYHNGQGTKANELGKRLISWFQKFSKEEMRQFFTLETDLKSQPLHPSHQTSEPMQGQSKQHDPVAALAAIEAGRKAAQQKLAEQRKGASI